MDSNTVYTGDFVDLSEEGVEIIEKKHYYKPFGIVSMVFGILSLASYVATFSMPFAILYPFIGLIFASFDLKRNKERSPFGKVGYITSMIALIIEIVLIAFFAVAVCGLVFLFLLSLGVI